jgi:peptide/nickel transport system ATP-binding protein
MSDRVAVMYLGQIVELGSAAQVLGEPRHPYTRLLDSVPRTGEPLDETLALRKTELPGNRHLPEGCFFRDRCRWQQGVKDPAATALSRGPSFAAGAVWVRFAPSRRPQTARWR